LRGFNTGEIYRNGFSINRGFISSPDSSNLERVEVLKGPASGLFGRGDPGGLVNMVTKRPQAEAFNQLKVSAGRWDKYRTALDVNRPLSDDGSLLARVNLAVEDNGSFRDYAGDERKVVSPSLLWQLSADTSIFIDAEFSRNKIVFDRGILPVNGKLNAIKKTRFLGEPNDGTIDSDSNVFHIALEHALSDEWKLRLSGQYLDGKLSGYTSSTGSVASLDPSTGMLSRALNYRDGFNVQDFAVHADVLGDFELLGWKHQLLAGLEYENFHNRYHFRGSATLPSYAINIYNPVYGQAKPALTSNPYSREYLENYAINLADQIYFSDRLSGLFGLRIERFEQTVRDIGSERKDDKDVLVPRAGISYKLTHGLSLFGGVGSSFKPNGADGSGGMLKPERGFGYEGGIKFELLEGRLGGTLSAFYMEKENVRQQPDPSVPLYVAIGEERSQGLDFHISGKITDALKIIGAYTFVDAEITKGNSSNMSSTYKKGTRLGNTPRHNGSVLTVYEFQEGILEKTHIGSAIAYVGERYSDTGGNIKLPSYTKVDLLGGYRINENLSFSANLNNVLNCTYYERGFRDFVLPGEPRNLNLSATLNF